MLSTRSAWQTLRNTMISFSAKALATAWPYLHHSLSTCYRAFNHFQFLGKIKQRRIRHIGCHLKVVKGRHLFKLLRSLHEFSDRALNCFAGQLCVSCSYRQGEKNLLLCEIIMSCSLKNSFHSILKSETSFIDQIQSLTNF